MKNRLLVIILFGVSLHSGYAQVDQELGNWLMYINNYAVDSKWSFQNLVILQDDARTLEMNQALLRTGVSYKLGKKWQASAGMEFIYVRPTNESDDEQYSYSSYLVTKSWQQMIYDTKVKKMYLRLRIWPEQTWKDNQVDFRQRFRLTFKYPLNNNKIEPKTFYLNGWEEIRFSTKAHPFNRNSIMMAIAYKANSTVAYRFGYHQHWFGKAQYNHRLHFSVIMSLASK